MSGNQLCLAQPHGEYSPDVQCTVYSETWRHWSDRRGGDGNWHCSGWKTVKTHHTIPEFT